MATSLDEDFDLCWLQILNSVATYPTIAQITTHLSPSAGLTPAQKSELVAQCLKRACIFGELLIVQYLLSDAQARPYLDLSVRDDDGVGLITMTIYGFGAESEHDVEREECVRLLVSQGADIGPDIGGWTPLHHAVLLSPPTLISYLMTHGCSAFDVTLRGLTPLDIVTAHSLMPGRDDVALLLEEAMRGEGWTGGRMEQTRRQFEEKSRRNRRQKGIRDGVDKILGVDPKWWGPVTDFDASDSDDEDEDDIDEALFTPPLDYTSMLVFSPDLLPQIFQSLIVNQPATFRNAQPANLLYMLTRFACLTCDHTWLEDLIIGATDAIEETVFAVVQNRGDDIACLVFWLYNTTLWLHLLHCDNSVNEACAMLGSFDIIEEVINSVFVFIIRFAERKVDQFLDSALLDYLPLDSEFNAVQFESEWSFLRPFSSKKKVHASTSSSPLRSQTRPSSPTSSTANLTPSSSRKFASLRSSLSRNRSVSVATPLQSLFQEASSTPSPEDITAFLTALHTLLNTARINPALTTQLWSQVMYWTSCEMFNRILTRKKYLCRSRAIQLSVNLGVLEEWVGSMGLPKGVQAHFGPVHDLLNWLQCLSSITEFSDLVATVQSFKHINPLQMRRAVKDYKYEVNEGRMTDECIQYLTQLQRDWERHRVKLGVEALRKEIGERDREREDSASFDSASIDRPAPSIVTNSSGISVAQAQIDMLFDRTADKTAWEPAKAPQVLGELFDSRYMLPLLFPSDPRMLAVHPGKLPFEEQSNNKRTLVSETESRSVSRASVRNHKGAMVWRTQHRKIRSVDVSSLQWVDGLGSAARWTRLVPEEDGDSDDGVATNDEDQMLRLNTHLTPLTRKPSGRAKGRYSQGGDTTPVERTRS
ncbi:hypothetical protein FISHEDRAFT_57371 [Fistulina hepatica ATCC 64428]|uniref:Dilute domain-containing protein n=1 Tax=Fistulina hepatica ATCC 64428 TaxID=1128425 RepID=A0A0D7AJQ0_9AGAR|nr:hypothetical protein FISHEDRAFT_57371 [Fistulina hepatica ATCC 64428]